MAGRRRLSEVFTMYSGHVTVVALGVYLAVVVSVARERAATLDDPPVLAYYYDIGNDTIFVNDRHDYPPMTAPSGGEGVFAIMLSCQSCEEEYVGTQFVGWIEKYNQGLREAYVEYGFAAEEIPPNLVNRGRLVAVRSRDPEWVPAAEAEGKAIIKRALESCDDRTPIRCNP